MSSPRAGQMDGWIDGQIDDRLKTTKKREGETSLFLILPSHYLQVKALFVRPASHGQWNGWWFIVFPLTFSLGLGSIFSLKRKTKDPKEFFLQGNQTALGLVAPVSFGDSFSLRIPRAKRVQILANPSSPASPALSSWERCPTRCGVGRTGPGIGSNSTSRCIGRGNRSGCLWKKSELLPPAAPCWRQ